MLIFCIILAAVCSSITYVIGYCIGYIQGERNIHKKRSSHMKEYLVFIGCCAVVLSAVAVGAHFGYVDVGTLPAPAWAAWYIFLGIGNPQLHIFVRAVALETCRKPHVPR